MHIRLAGIAASVLLSAVAAGHTSAQAPPPPIRFTPPQFRLQIRPSQPDTSVRLFAQLLPSAVRQCPMPVAVPDSASLERMPTARLEPAHDPMPIERPGCVNPLAPQSRGHKAPGAPPHP